MEKKFKNEYFRNAHNSICTLYKTKNRKEVNKLIKEVFKVWNNPESLKLNNIQESILSDLQTGNIVNHLFKL